MVSVKTTVVLVTAINSRVIAFQAPSTWHCISPNPSPTKIRGRYGDDARNMNLQRTRHPNPGTQAAYLNQALQKTRPAAVLFVVSAVVSAGRSAELGP